MAYAQWIQMVIVNLMKSNNLTVKHLNASWGKFFEWNDKDAEVSAPDVEKQAAKPSGKLSIASCGRSDSPSGTTGTVDLYDGETRICKVYWNCPWGEKHNDFSISDIDDKYLVQQSGANLGAGAIGTVEIKVVKLD